MKKSKIYKGLIVGALIGGMAGSIVESVCSDTGCSMMIKAGKKLKKLF